MTEHTVMVDGATVGVRKHPDGDVVIEVSTEGQESPPAIQFVVNGVIRGYVPESG